MANRTEDARSRSRTILETRFSTRSFEADIAKSLINTGAYVGNIGEHTFGSVIAQIVTEVGRQKLSDEFVFVIQQVHCPIIDPPKNNPKKLQSTCPVSLGIDLWEPFSLKNVTVNYVLTNGSSSNIVSFGDPVIKTSNFGLNLLIKRGMKSMGIDTFFREALDDVNGLVRQTLPARLIRHGYTRGIGRVELQFLDSQLEVKISK